MIKTNDMKKINQQVTPMNSHLVMFDKPKMGVIEGFVEEVYGMTISDYYCIDENGMESFNTVRTILIGEELKPSWSIDSFRDDTDIYFFKEFPKLSIKDIKNCLCSVKNVRSYSEMFDDLEEKGCYTDLEGKVLEATIYEKETPKGVVHEIYIRGVHRVYIEAQWIPAKLEKMFSLQHYLKCRIHLKSKDLNQATLDMMNELLENHAKNGIKVAHYMKNEECVNDGVYTYHLNGLKEKMTREEFMNKYPDSLDYYD